MKTNKKTEQIFLLLIGGVGIALSGINWTVGIAAWIAPIFLLMFTRKARWLYMLFFFLVVAVAGSISQTSNNLFHLVAVDIFNGVTFGIVYSVIYAIDKILYKKGDRFYATLIFPSVMVLAEFLISLKIGTWGIIAHTQFEMKSLIQFSSIAGVFGISFIVAWFSSVVNWIFERKSDSRLVYQGIFIYASVLTIILLYGGLRMKLQYSVGKTVKVATVLSETEVHQIVEREKDAMTELAANYTADIPPQMFSDSLAVKALVARTSDAAKQGAKIIVWNEIALILNQTQKKDLLAEIQSECLKNDVYVLVAFLEENEDRNRKPFNNVSILIAPDGKVVWEYQKSFLHPYAEAPIINSGNFEIPVIQTSSGKLGNVICSDLDMPSYIKQAGREAVDILLVPAYDWPGITPLHAEMACLEAIQFGFSLVRANGKGLAIITDYLGNTLASVNTLTSDTKIIYADVPIKSVKTFYSSVGDLIVYLAMLFLVFLIIRKIVKRKVR